MTTGEATRLYNDAEDHVLGKLPKLSFMYRAEAILVRLTSLYGEDTADEILDLVFENEIL
jgi:hypothetical protein